MDRTLRGAPETATVTFYEDGVTVDPGSVSVSISSLAGQSLTGGSASGTGAAARTFALSFATHTALLDTLTLTWTSATKGTRTTVVEVVGGFLFNLAEARTITPLDDTTKYSTADLLAMRTTVEQALEQACGCAFVPRFTQDTLDGSGSGSLLLSRPLVSRVRSATVGGTALGAPDIAALTLSTAGTVYSSGTWTAGYNNVVVGYEHGFQDPPLEIRRAALMLAKMWLVGRRNPIDDRAVTFSATEGGTYSLAVPGRNGSSFGHPDVDVAVDRYSFATGIA